MKKIQQLLNKHKDKLGYPELSVLTQDRGFKIYKHRNHSNPLHYRSLSEILFNTPFLSWLEWKSKTFTHRITFIGKEDSVKYPGCMRIHKGRQNHKSSPSSDYHKINLALLSTDEERIIYIENNTL